MSPIVLAGAVRMIELALVALIGTAIYTAYVVPMEGLSWHYFIAIAAVSVLTMLAFQIADIYQVQAFRGHEKQYFRLASAWSVVFLLLIGASFFAKAGEEFSRVWLGSFYVIGLVALLAFRRMLFVMVRRWTQEGRLNRRTAIVGGGEAGEQSDRCDQGRARHRRAHRRRVRRPRRRPLAARTSRASASSAPSTISSNSRAGPASIW